MNARVEVDLIGSREVPEDVYWGVHTLRASENFPISGVCVSDVPDFVRAMVEVKKAEALANRDAHVLSEEKAEAISKACDRILVDGCCMDQFPVDLFQGGAGTSVNMNTNEVIANLALETMGLPKGRYDVINPNDDVNKSQSTNDAYPAGLRIATYRLLMKVIDAFAALADSFDSLAQQHQRTLKMGRTQLQDAVPMSSGQEFAAFAVWVRQGAEYMQRQAADLLVLNLGSTAIGTGINTPEGFQDIVIKRMAEVTGLPVVGAKNLVAATPDCADYVAVHGGMRRAAVNLSKICNDLRLLSSGPRAGIKELNLPQMQAGSSIMPAKVNPVIPEVTNQVCFKVMGNDTTVMIAAEAGQLQLNVMEPVIAQCLFESARLLTNAVDGLRTHCVDHITVNVETCHDYVMNSIGLVTYLNEIIGHHEGDEVGKECAKTGKSVREVVLERKLMTAAELDEVLSPENLLNPKYVGEKFA